MTLSDVGLVLAIVAVSGVLYPHLLYPLLLWGGCTGSSGIL